MKKTLLCFAIAALLLAGCTTAAQPTATPDAQAEYVPVVSVTYDGTGGNKNESILPYLKFPR